MAVHAGRALFDQGIGDRRGNAQRGVLVWVYDRGTTTLSTLWTDRTKATEADNPISTNGLGNLAIFADPGDYEAHVDSTGAVLYFTVLPDWEDGGAGGAVVTLTGDQTIEDVKTFTGPLRLRQGETQFDVLAYGGVASVAAATATFQAAAAEWSANGGGKLNFPANGDYTVNGRIPLPTVAASWIKHYEVAGNGCILRGASGYAGPLLGDALPVDTAAVLLGRMMRIHGFQMFGDGATAGQEGIRVIGGQNHLVHHNKIRSLDIGIDLIFCLGAHVAYNEVTVNRTYDIVVRAGLNGDGSPLWAGATGAGTASNATRIEKCRSYGDAAVKAQIAVLASDEAEVINCITEGVAGEVAVLIDALGNTSARYCRVHNLHSENFPTVAVVKVVPSGGRVVISGVRNDLGALLVDGRGANTTTVFDLDLQSLFGADMFWSDAGGGIWCFHNPGSYGRTDPTDTALWKGGTKPYIRVDRLSNPTQEPGISDSSAVLQSYAGGKFVAANGGAVIAGGGAPDASYGNTGDTFVRKEGGVVQKLAGTWADVPERLVAHGNTGATETIDVAAGTVHTATLDANCTLTFTAPPAGTFGWSLTLVLTQDGTGTRTVTWPASVKWPGGTAPTLSIGAGKVDVLSFFTIDAGTTWRGALAQADSR